MQIKNLQLNLDVRNIPTVLVFQNGEVVGRQVGVAPKNVYEEAINSLL